MKKHFDVNNETIFFISIFKLFAYRKLGFPQDKQCGSKICLDVYKVNIIGFP